MALEVTFDPHPRTRDGRSIRPHRGFVEVQTWRKKGKELLKKGEKGQCHTTSNCLTLLLIVIPSFGWVAYLPYECQYWQEIHTTIEKFGVSMWMDGWMDIIFLKKLILLFSVDALNWSSDSKDLNWYKLFISNFVLTGFFFIKESGGGGGGGDVEHW